MQNCLVEEAGVEAFDPNQNPNPKNNRGKHTTTSELLLTAFNLEKNPKIDNTPVTTWIIKNYAGLLQSFQKSCHFHAAVNQGISEA